MNKEDLKRLYEALLAAFPSRSELERLFTFRIGTSLAQVVPDHVTTRDAVLGIIQWAESEGRVDELVAAARAERPGNQALQEFIASPAVIEKSGVVEPPQDRNRPTSAFLAGPGSDGASQKEAMAFELTERRAHTAAAELYVIAIKELTPDASPAQKQRLYEGLVYNLLYVGVPDGYQRAQKYALEYVSDRNPPSARVWTYLAAAYGQEYAYARSAATADERRRIRDRALEAVRQALRLDPKFKTTLQKIWDPSYLSESSDENDLEVFFHDPEFAKLLADDE